jgi:hypothetical protein
MIGEHSHFGPLAFKGKIIAIIFVILFGVFGFHSGATYGTANADGTTYVSSDSLDSESDVPDDFDLERCQRYCSGSPGGSNVMASQVGSCIQDCNEKYWKSYDKRMKRLK